MHTCTAAPSGLISHPVPAAKTSGLKLRPSRIIGCSSRNCGPRSWLEIGKLAVLGPSGKPPGLVAKEVTRTKRSYTSEACASECTRVRLVDLDASAWRRSAGDPVLCPVELWTRTGCASVMSVGSRQAGNAGRYGALRGVHPRHGQRRRVRPAGARGHQCRRSPSSWGLVPHEELPRRAVCGIAFAGTAHRSLTSHSVPTISALFSVRRGRRANPKER